MATPIRILVAEDNHLTRTGTVTLLESQADLQVVAEAENGAQAIERFKEHRPDVTVADLRMPLFDGIQVVAAIVGIDAKARVLMLTHYDGSEDVFRALEAGAAGYITKEIRGEELINAVRRVHAGERYTPAHIKERLAEHAARPRLSPREAQVLERIYEGMRNVDIAADLEIGEKTVIMYVSNILSKLGVKSRTEAAKVALEQGLLPRQGP